jgi:hypothetical protein
MINDMRASFYKKLSDIKKSNKNKDIENIHFIV